MILTLSQSPCCNGSFYPSCTCSSHFSHHSFVCEAAQGALSRRWSSSSHFRCRLDSSNLGLPCFWVEEEFRSCACSCLRAGWFARTGQTWCSRRFWCYLPVASWLCLSGCWDLIAGFVCLVRHSFWLLSSQRLSVVVFDFLDGQRFRAQWWKDFPVALDSQLLESVDWEFQLVSWFYFCSLGFAISCSEEALSARLKPGRCSLQAHCTYSSFLHALSCLCSVNFKLKFSSSALASILFHT